MVSQQARTWGVPGLPLTQAMESLNRQQFVPKRYQKVACADICIPLRYGRNLVSPVLSARLITALKLTNQSHVLEVGTDSGYHSALLGKVSKDVVSVDTLRANSDDASLKMVELGVNNVTFQTGNALTGWEKGSPFDAILINGAIPFVPSVFKNLLKKDGRLVAVVGVKAPMQAVCITRQSNDLWTCDSLFDTELPVVKSMKPDSQFEF
jgi:protein-L-isoaspartate(D-aspartate) O-methyltransferase